MRSQQPTGFLPVFAALVGNVFITSIKFAGFWFTGSSSMFSEAVHGIADTGNQALLMFGIKRSLKKADEKFQYGFGQERFFWALISACGIFFLGAGVTMYHGLTALYSQEHVATHPIVFGILFVSLIIELATLTFAYREMKMQSGQTEFLDVIAMGDPSTLAVIYEDGVAVAGSFIAAVSIALTKLTGNPVWDAIGSIIIGILLAVIAIVLIKKNREYLLKKAMPAHLEEIVIDLLSAEPAIEKVIDFKSSVLDIDVYSITCEVEFNGSELLKEMNKFGELRCSFEEVREDYSDFFRFCIELTDRSPRVLGTKINEIEKRIRDAVPQVRHIDIEIN
jgi:zinc transporter 9